MSEKGKAPGFHRGKLTGSPVQSQGTGRIGQWKDLPGMLGDAGSRIRSGTTTSTLPPQGKAQGRAAGQIQTPNQPHHACQHRGQRQTKQFSGHFRASSVHAFLRFATEHPLFGRFKTETATRAL